MTRPRKKQVHLDVTPYYHCTSRCVQQAFLCGLDRYSGKNFEHRRGWMQERLAWLADVFAIDVCAYAMMSNHSHVVLRVVRSRALAWSADEVVARHGLLYPVVTARLDEVGEGDREALIETWRKRLYSVSWFMRALNQWFASRANREVGRSGRFWEGRFKSQALLDHDAVLSCMAYVDLNPVRAGMCDELEACDFTSIQQRLAEYGARGGNAPELEEAGRDDGNTVEVGSAENDAGQSAKPCPLMPFAPNEKLDAVHGEFTDLATLPITFANYVDLLRWTGRAIRGGGGRLRAPPTSLSRIAKSSDAWVNALGGDRLGLPSALGNGELLNAYATQQGVRWIRGRHQLGDLFERGRRAS